MVGFAAAFRGGLKCEGLQSLIDHKLLPQLRYFDHQFLEVRNVRECRADLLRVVPQNVEIRSPAQIFWADSSTRSANAKP
jgi:hypothetical protein